MTHSSQEISMESKLVVNPNMVLREEGEEGALLFDPDSGAVRILNVTAVAIWKLLDGRRTLSEVMASLRGQFEDIDADAEQQVLAAAEELHRIGAVGTEEGLAR